MEQKVDIKNKTYKADDLYLADWSEQMSQVLKAGLTIEDGIEFLRNDSEEGSKEHEALEIMLNEIQITGSLSEAMEMAGIFPDEMIRMVDLGETTGNLEKILATLKTNYERQHSLKKSIQNAVMYPIYISLVMVSLISIILIFVMPVFKRAYASLGLEMTGLANTLFKLGNWLGSTGLPIVVILLVALFVVLIYQRYRSVKDGTIPFERFLKNYELLDACNFASVMALTFAGGITIEEGLNMAKELNTSETFVKKIDDCKSRCENGEHFYEAVKNAGIMDGRCVRRIQMAERTAEIDSTMQDIADDLQIEIDENIDSRMGKVEPLLIIILTAVAALILLSVMLPLLGIMSTL
ncbi:MAG: type II secretion system F family protein [Lachnospiraceae bacterium]|nr:type II secretion system F family protein [Lachnospiraceae bacterium]